MNKKWDSIWRCAAASVVAAGLCSPLEATVVNTFNDRSLWQTSLTAIQTEDFNAAITGPFAGFGAQLYNNSLGFQSSVMQFLGEVGAGPSYELKRLQVGGSGGPTYLVGPNWTVAANDPRLDIVISNAATAFGINVASSIPGITYQFRIIQVSGTDIVTMGAASPQAPTMAFFGVHTDSAIQRVEIRMSSGMLDGGDEEESRFDDASVGFLSGGGGGAVPEPSTVLFSLTGIGLLAWTRRRQLSSLIRN